jgi:DNA-binding LacI/PurR family transcriptional regulator
MATINDVIRESGVSRSTVFRFMKGDKVRPQARSKIQQTIKNLNFFYNPRDSRQDILLVISVKELFEGMNVYADMVAGAMSRASALGLHLILESQGGGKVCERIGGSEQWKRMGVILIGKSADEEDAEAAEYRQKGIPFVFVNRVFEDSTRSFVSADLRAAARQAVEHLLALGHTEIGTWGRPKDYSIDREKLLGYREAFTLRGLPVPASYATYEDDGDLEPVARRLFSSSEPPHAWLGLSDTHIMRLGAVLRELGLRAPEDVALVGMDDIETSRYFTPPLTTVHFPFRQAGSNAVDLLLDLIEDPVKSAAHVFLRHELIIRESCGAHLKEKS